MLQSSIFNPAVMRPLIGLSAMVVLMFVFRPLLSGLLRAALLALKPRRSPEQIALHRNMKGVRMMNRLAHDYSSTHPSLAAELRSIAARN